MRALITAEYRPAIRTILLFAALMWAPVSAQAQSITLAWDPSPDTDVVGYTVHVGINPGVFGQTFDVSGRTNTSFTYTQALPGQFYYFAVSAYNSQNVSSALSNVVSWKINVGPTIAPPPAQTGAVGAAVSLQMTAVDDGDPLTFTATGLPPGLSMSSAGRITGTPTTAGTYTVGVTVSDGSLSAATTFTWTINGRLSVTGLTSAIPSPQIAGVPILFTASATDGVGPYQYKFLQTLGSNTSVVRDWANSASFTWTPSQAGNYVVTVWARSAGVTADVAEDAMTMNYVINLPPMSVTGLAANRPSPQYVNTSITFTAAATGGIAPYQYKYLLTANGNTTTVRNWSTSALYTWTPTVANAYTMTVWVRSAGQTVDSPEAQRTVNFTITGPFTLSGITSNISSPQVVGASVTFTAVSSGGATPHQYKWWVHDGIDWRVLREWATGTYTWTPSVPNSNYRIAVWARAADVTSDTSAYNLSVSYPITAPPPSPPPTITGLTSNVPSPQVAGTSVTFTTTATGGRAPYQYKYWLSSGSDWTIVRDWNGSNTFTWTPTQANANYRIAVWVRNSTTLSDTRDADMSISYPITAPASAPTLSVTGLTGSLPSPQVAGTPVTFTASATGGVAPYQYKFWVFNGSAWSIVRDWNGSNSYTWTPTQANSSYRVSVWVRNATTTTDTRDGDLSIAYPITVPAGPAPLTVTGLTSSVPAPQNAGTSIAFTAAATGGVAPYQYKFWVTDGSTWSIVRDWSGSNGYTWTPTQANSNYRVAVWVRNATTTTDTRDGDLSVSFPITAPSGGNGGPLTVTGLTSNVPSPQTAGTSVTFSAVASGGVAPYQYKFWVWNGSTWNVVREWNASNNFTWTPLQANSNYRVSVWVRNATTTTDTRDGDLAVSYPITASSSSGGPLTITGLTANVPSPQVAGTSVTFTAAATGGAAPYQYMFWVWNGSTWSVVRDWSGSNTFTWTPTQPNTGYRVSVWARNATTTTDTRDADLAIPYPITAASAPGPLTVTALTSSVPSPQVTGTPITFTASATGGVAPYQYKFWVSNGGSWTVVRDWSGSSSYTWTPTLANANYRVSVWVRNATTLTDTRDGDLSVAYPIIAPTAPGALTVTALTSNVASPQVAGTPITFTAAATGGVAPYQYKFWVWNGSVWMVVRDWNGSSSFTWTPTQASSNYRVAVWVRNASTTTDVRDGDLAVPFMITAPAGSAPLSFVLLASSLSAPQRTGTPVTFTAVPSGGSGSYHYKWWLWDGTVWSVQRDWSTSSTFTWMPTRANANYRIGVWVREASSNVDSSAINATMWFAIQP
jgi:hypothetical protein